MRIGLSDRFPKVRRAALVAFVGSIAVFQLFGLLGLRINTSPSLPVGLYVVTTDRSANLVEFCPAEPFARLALIRRYRDPGICRDGGAPLLKPIVAKARIFAMMGSPHEPMYGCSVLKVPMQSRSIQCGPSAPGLS